MENENERDKVKKDSDEKGKIRDYIEQMAQSKETSVAKDLVQLKHVEVKKQEISPATQNLANALKEQYIEHDQFERLSNDELTVLESFTNKRMFLTRIAIIANQSRIPLGIEPFNKADLEKILDTLKSKNYIEVELVGEKNVYILTERGKYRLQ
jgi:hypothetical protein